MYITCLDLEGVLVPEIWIAFAQARGIPELERTTRDEPDYDKLMTWRLGILKEHGLGLKEIQATIAKIDPLPGAKAFLDELRATGTPVLDYELGGGHGLREDQFFDGFHIDTVYGLPQYTATLLADANAALGGNG